MFQARSYQELSDSMERHGTACLSIIEEVRHRSVVLRHFARLLPVEVKGTVLSQIPGQHSQYA